MNNLITPVLYEKLLQDMLAPTGLNLSNAFQLAPKIKNLSDHFIQEKARSTPWDDTKLVAYSAYFGLLNYSRVRHAINRINDVSPQKLCQVRSVVEWGSGTGASSLALQEGLPEVNWNFIDHSHIALSFHERWANSLNSFDSTNWYGASRLAWNNELTNKTSISDHSMFFACYALNESLPTVDFKRFEQILILEPSNWEHSQKLIDFREQRLAEGFTAIAPCPHQLKCPMQGLKNYWCHDRAHWEKPKWFRTIEDRIGIRSDTLPYSYLYLVKNHVDINSQPSARVVGDELTEKGKTRWSLCNDGKLERMAFLHRNGEPPQIKRGDQIVLSDFDFEVKGGEYRFTQAPASKK